MRYRDPDQEGMQQRVEGESTEQQLRRQVDELRRQLHDREAGQAGPAANRWRPSGITVSALILCLALLFTGAFLAGYLRLQKRDALVRAETSERVDETPRAEVLRVSRAAAKSDLSLPGTLQAVTEAPVLARADGYLKRRLADIGDRVSAGQALAEIDAPEIDQQIRQAEAAVEQAQAAVEQTQAAAEQAQAALEQGKANRDLASVTAGRWKALAAQGVVSQQENDQYQAQLTAQSANVQALEKAALAQRSTVAAARANVAAARANVARLQEIQGYRVVKAPFDGVITVRNVDVGALVSTGTTLLYRIAQTRTLRAFVNVPQSDANSVRAGQPAQLTLSNFPGRQFSGRVTRTANALDPASRTMLTEIEVPNPAGVLFPGMYAEVGLSSARVNPPLVIPAQALIVRTDGAQVALVQPDGTVHLAKVAVGKDYGDRVEIIQGVQEGATILANADGAPQEGAKIVPVSRDGGKP